MPKVFRCVKCGVNNVALAGDLTSATFEKALVNFKRYSGDKASFSTWVFFIARSTIIDHYS